MSTTNKEQDELVTKIYNYAASLLVEEKRTEAETRAALVAQGLDEESAAIVVENLVKQIKAAKKERGNKDMLYGGLWCVGGIVATASGIGLIFWGAILFGAVQFIKGAVNS